MTEPLYEANAYLQTFTAVVTGCAPAPGGWAVTLDRTAFYPEGGGQPCDTGTLGGARVLAVHAAGGEVAHLCDAPLEAGRTVAGAIDWAARLDAMQQHTGEHILSGALHRLFGAENVGFHIGSPWVRMDTSIPLTPEQLAEAEAAANDAVRSRHAGALLCARRRGAGRNRIPQQKRAGRPRAAGGSRRRPLRLLRHPPGPHRRGGAGQDRIVPALQGRHAAGRGLRAARLRRCGCRLADAEAAGRLLSAPVGRLAEAAGHLRAGEGRAKQRLAALQNALADAWAAAAAPGQLCTVQADGADGDGLRRIAMAVAAASGAPCCALAPGGRALPMRWPPGRGGDVRAACRALNEAFAGRGGGKAGFCQGSLADADAARVRAFLRQL